MCLIISSKYFFELLQIQINNAQRELILPTICIGGKMWIDINFKSTLYSAYSPFCYLTNLRDIFRGYIGLNWNYLINFNEKSILVWSIISIYQVQNIKKVDNFSPLSFKLTFNFFGKIKKMCKNMSCNISN